MIDFLVRERVVGTTTPKRLGPRFGYVQYLTCIFLLTYIYTSSQKSRTLLPHGDEYIEHPWNSLAPCFSSSTANPRIWGANLWSRQTTRLTVPVVIEAAMLSVHVLPLLNTQQLYAFHCSLIKNFFTNPPSIVVCPIASKAFHSSG